MWAVITDPKRDLEGGSVGGSSDIQQRIVLILYLPYGLESLRLESLRLKEKWITSKLDKQMGSEEILKELISP